MKVNKKKKNKEGPKLAMEVEQQMTRKRTQPTDTKLHFGTVKGRYKPWEKRPKKERNKGIEKGNETNKDKKKREETETGM